MRPEYGPDPDEIIDAALERLRLRRGRDKGPPTACVGVVRNYALLPPRPGVTYKHLLMMRDPRDLVVSAYFSFGWTHNISPENRIASKIRAQTVNEYATGQLPGSARWIKPRFDPLLALRANHTQFIAARDGLVGDALPVGAPYARYLVTYDSLVLGPYDFQSGIARFLELPPHAAEALVSSGKINIDNLNSKKGAEAATHKRAIVPGNYRVHLDGPTRAALSALFSSELDLYAEIGGMAFEPYSAYDPPNKVVFNFDETTGKVTSSSIN